MPTTMDDIKLLEQSAFNAGVAYAMSEITLNMPGLAMILPYPEASEMEEGMETWRTTATTKRLESRVKNG